MQRSRSKTTMLVLSLAAALASSGMALAAETKPFTPAALEAAQASGKPILVEVSAPWCPVCKAQKPILSGLLADPKYADLVAFDIDFDSQKAAWKKLGVNSQSTLIVYRGSTEKGRTVGDTSKAGIQALIDKAL